MFTDNSYKGEAEVIGCLSSRNGTVDFTGTWHDEGDEIGIWDDFIDFKKPDIATYTLTCREPDPD